MVLEALVLNNKSERCKMTVSYKTMQKNKKLDEFGEKKEEEGEEEQG